MCQLLELFRQSEQDETGSAGDVEEYKRETKTVIFASALFCTVGRVVLVAVKVCFDQYVLVLPFLVTPNVTLLTSSKCW